MKYDKRDIDAVMNKRITVTLTEDQFNHVIRGLGYTIEDFMEDYGGLDKFAAKENKRVTKVNAYVQRLIDNLIEQARK